MRDRAYRRAQHMRHKTKAAIKIKQWFGSFNEASTPNPVALGKATNTRTLCSCCGCGNPRRHYSDKHSCALTLQEKRQLERETGDWE